MKPIVTFLCSSTVICLSVVSSLANSPTLLVDGRLLETSAGASSRGSSVSDADSKMPGSPFAAFDDQVESSVSGGGEGRGEAYQRSTIFPLMFEGEGSAFGYASANVEGGSSSSASAGGYAKSLFEVRFELDGSFDYLFAGWGNVGLTSDGAGVIPLLASGSLSPGIYTLTGVAEASAGAAFNGESDIQYQEYSLSLSLAERSVPDTGGALGATMVMVFAAMSWLGRQRIARS